MSDTSLVALHTEFTQLLSQLKNRFLLTWPPQNCQYRALGICSLEDTYNVGEGRQRASGQRDESCTNEQNSTILEMPTASWSGSEYEKCFSSRDNPELWWWLTAGIVNLTQWGCHIAEIYLLLRFVPTRFVYNARISATTGYFTGFLLGDV